MTGKLNPLSSLLLLWLLGAYLLIAVLLDWTGLSSHSNVVLEAIAGLIPSVQGYAALSPDRDKAVFELVMAWLVGFAIPALMLPTLDWNWILGRSALKGNLKTALLFLATGVLLFLLMFYPDPPSDARRTGRVILALFESDVAFIWGAAVAALVGLGLTLLAAGGIHLYKTARKSGQS